MRSLQLFVLSSLFLFACFLIFSGQDKSYVSQFEHVLSTTDSDHADATLFSVVSVTDGDTIKVRIGEAVQTIRLIGIDAPESVEPRTSVECFGQEAAVKMRSLLGGKQVRLADDPSQGDYDAYHRLLRYVYLLDGTMVNALLLKEGYAFEYTYHTPYKYQDEFKALQADAASKKYGLWNDKTCNGL